MKNDSKIFVAGQTGLVGSAICRKLNEYGFYNIVDAPHIKYDLTDRLTVEELFDEERPEYVFLAAAKVGGIHANETYPAEFIYQNLQISVNVIDTAYRYGTQKLLYLGSSCIYPKMAKQPIEESELFNGYLEPTNEAYAVAKIAGIKMCQAYNKQYNFNAICLQPTNLYGTSDNFHLDNSHVIPALIHRFHLAKINNQDVVRVWGSGRPRREFLFVDDFAESCLFLMQNYNDSEIINVGCGEDITIFELAKIIKDIVGFSGHVEFDHTKPDGTPRKLLNCQKLFNLGWKPKTNLEEGLQRTYNWFVENYDLQFEGV